MNRKSTVSSSTISREFSEKNSPRLEDYDIMEEIGSGKASTVYLVNCKRGRLRNRQLALRKVPANQSKPTELSGSSFIHLSLSHPCIISLFSTFSTPLADFHVLELCSGGTLSSYLERTPLSEGHLRGVLKSLFEALIYLKKQGVVHRNIRPSNVLLTTDGRIKLCDFKLATHLPPSKLPVDYFTDAPHFVAPEILRNSPYTCDADLWSTGDASGGSPSNIPVGTTRPLPLTTALLSPEIHKTVHGQITVLPSCSLLVDLREGERRRGQKGTEVLVINSEGTEIEVYSAPHLSLPCCLAEPIKRYTIDNLPSTYWRQYNDAALLVERIKQRTPKLILHTPAAKCVLMANASRGDIELLFGLPPPPNGRKQGTAPPADAARMRIRVSRQNGSLEIAKHVSGARGEEWTKKVLKTIDEYPHIGAPDWDKLDATERDSMTHLARFWRTCEVLEHLEESEDHPTSHPHSDKLGASKARTSRTLSGNADSPNALTTRILPASFSSTQTLPTSVAPKLSFVPPSRKPVHPECSPSLIDIASIEGQYPSVTGKTGILPTWCRDDDDDDVDLTRHHALDSQAQTKYIPSVGWCIRQSSRVSQGGRYKIMFFDGTTLEIDVDEDWAQLTGPEGETTRYNIRECNMKRHVAERMKVFGDFVSMFDQTEEG
ncbi:Protein kinase domain-containing protein [Mycena venus]|uniref:Protein kinase domain-containing protein n=1 Tax=Mycena venus TaxID=2733690 RepID=A0A8H6YS49_9AGAR|nr:Protein kinase domain-containing protein [Mycena venus]